MSISTVRLGVMPPLSGVVGIYGPEISWAAQIACEQVNEQGGVLGRPLEIVFRDDGSLPESAVSAARSLIHRHRCVALVGNLLSNSRYAVAYQVAEPRRIPYLNFSFYEGSISSRYFFHFAALPNQQIDRMIPAMVARYGRRMFFAGNDYEWPRGSIDAAKRVLTQAGGEVLLEEYHPIGVSEDDLEKLLDHLEAAKPDVFVPYFAGVDQLHLLTQFARRKLNHEMAVVMGHFDEMQASQLAPAVREGLYSCNTYFMTIDTPENRRYMERLARMPGVTGIWPHGNGILTNFGEGAYLCVKAFAQAANQAGSLEPEALVQALQTVQLRGPQGEVSMDPATHHARVNSFLSRCEADGSFTIVERFGVIAPVLPERYRRAPSVLGALGAEDIRLQSRILQQIAEAVFLLDARSGEILYANPASERMFGYAPADLAGRRLDMLLAKPDRPPGTLNAEINRDLYEKGTWQHVVGMVRQDGQPLWCAVTVSSFTHPRLGEVWLAVHLDITELIRLTEEIARRSAELAELRELDQMKEQFLSAASHEIRTPLSLILGYAELLQDRLGEDDELIKGLVEGARRLSFQVSKLVDSQALLSGTLPLYCSELDLKELLEGMGQGEARRFREKGLTFVTLVAPEPMLVKGDSKRVNQMIYELLDNARRYTPSGGAVTLSADVAGDCVRISVIDTGPGIPPSSDVSIWEAYRRPPVADNTGQAGLGLGLTLVRRLAELHGGHVELESSPGEGSRFSILLPLLRDDHASDLAACKSVGANGP